MNLINAILGIPLGYVTYLAYRLTGSFGLAILIFAFIVRVIMFPVIVLAHKNAISFLRLQSPLSVIKRRYAGDKEQLSEEQYMLFKKEKYSPLMGLIPLLIQLLLIMGMLQVMYHPLQHMLRFESDIIGVLTQTARRLYSTDEVSTREQLLVVESLQRPENLQTFQAALTGYPDAERIMYIVSNMDLNFIGLNLGEIPSLTNLSAVLLVPLLAGLTALAFCLVQNTISPGAMSQGKRTNLGLTVFTVVLSLYFAFTTPTGVGIYWAAGNLFATVTVFILNMLYNPKKLAGEAIVHLRASKKTSAQIKKEKLRKKELSEWEKSDATLFRDAKKHLVFYALTGGQYKFYKNVIEYLLENSAITIHYLSNDPNDAVFRQQNGQLVSYYASQRKTISLMLKLDADILVTTVPDLQRYHIKRTIVRDDTEYIYVFHNPASTFLVVRETAFDNFDTVFCVGPHQIAELRRREELAGLRRRRLVKTGYGLYDQLIDAYASMSCDAYEKPQIVIAPSWQAGNILELCIDDILETLLGRGYNIVVRPHPQFIGLFPDHIQSLTEKYALYAAEREIIFELNFSDNQSIFSSDLLITDWSAIAYEFSYCTLKPSLFINTPMKVMNPNYELYDMEVLDISLRDKVGVSINLDEIRNLNEIISSLLYAKDSYREHIAQVIRDYLYYPGRSGEAGGKYIMNQLETKGITTRKAQAETEQIKEVQYA